MSVVWPPALMEQPWILMEEFGVVITQLKLHDAFEAQQRETQLQDLLSNIGTQGSGRPNAY